MSAEGFRLFHEVSRLHGQTADYHLHIYLTSMRALQKAWLSVVLSVVPVLVAVNSHESLTALDMFDSDLWVAILLPHYLIIPRKPTDNSGIIL